MPNGKLLRMGLKAFTKTRSGRGLVKHAKKQVGMGKHALRQAAKMAVKDAQKQVLKKIET